MPKKEGKMKTDEIMALADEMSFAQQNPDITGHISTKLRQALQSAIEALQADAAKWRRLYSYAINEANGLTNYVEDRPELYSAEKRLAKIEAEARAAMALDKG